MDSSSYKTKHNQLDGNKYAENHPYRQLIGSLVFIMIATCPYITFSVGRLSQYCENLRQKHWNAVKLGLRYLKGTRDLLISYGIIDSLSYICCSDSDLGGCHKSTESFILLLTGGAIYGRCKKQTVIEK